MSNTEIENQRPKVIYVEPDGEMRTAMCEVLALEGIPATGFRTAEEASEHLWTGSGDEFVLTEKLLPGISGYDWARSELQPLGVSFGFLSRNWDLVDPIPEDLKPTCSLEMPERTTEILAAVRKGLRSKV